ncbi:hypothetical protein HDU76_012720 [Blyttiomyces sp. JEL0837]|nr:hypothetical protein HDU76_012720 [Blyttiomyces sp. JEL0837]
MTPSSSSSSSSSFHRFREARHREQEVLVENVCKACELDSKMLAAAGGGGVRAGSFATGAVARVGSVPGSPTTGTIALPVMPNGSGSGTLILPPQGASTRSSGGRSAAGEEDETLNYAAPASTSGNHAAVAPSTTNNTTIGSNLKSTGMNGRGGGGEDSSTSKQKGSSGSGWFGNRIWTSAAGALLSLYPFVDQPDEWSPVSEDDDLFENSNSNSDSKQNKDLHPSSAPTTPTTPSGQGPSFSFPLSHSAAEAPIPNHKDTGVAAKLPLQPNTISTSTTVSPPSSTAGSKSPRSLSLAPIPGTVLNIVRILDHTNAMSFWHQFKAFIIQTRVLETGVGVIIGRAFQEVIRSFVNDLLVPPVAFVFGDRVMHKFVLLKHGRTPGMRYKTVEEALADGAITLNYGRFGHQSFNFFIVGLSVYYLLRALKTFFEWRISLTHTKKCLFCISDIHVDATRCAFCTAAVAPVVGSPVVPAAGTGEMKS